MTSSVIVIHEGRPGDSEPPTLLVTLAVIFSLMPTGAKPRLGCECAGVVGRCLSVELYFPLSQDQTQAP